MTAFIIGALLTAATWTGLTIRRRLNRPYPGGPVQTYRSAASAASTAHIIVNVQQVDPAQLAAMVTMFAAAARQGHPEITAPSAQALDTAAGRLAITRPDTDDTVSHEGRTADDGQYVR